MKAKYTYWKIGVVLLFTGLICWGLNLQSEYWISFAKGILFFSNLSDMQQLELIQYICFCSVPILSVLFLLIRNRTISIVLISLMIVNILVVFPFRYVEDQTMTF